MIVCILAVVGCAEEGFRDSSQAAMAAGHFDAAVQILESGVREYPNSAQLRLWLVRARSQVVTRQLTQASRLRGAGHLDAAQRLLEHALVGDPGNDQFARMLAEVIDQKRSEAALTNARALVESSPDMALQILSAALKVSPRDQGLVALQRSIEAAQRAARLTFSRPALSDDRPIPLDFRDTGLRTVLDVVSRSSGINFVLDPDIRQDTHVTVCLPQANLEDALDLLLGINKLAMKVLDSNTVLIYPNTPEKQRDYREQVVRVFYLANAQAKGAASFLKQMLRIREPFVDERSNMLALRDSLENIQLAERLIALYDGPDPEVLLEVQVLEINSTRLTELGVQFPSARSLSAVPPGTDAALTLGNLKSLTRDNLSLGLGAVTVNLRRQVGDLSTLANPSIRVKSKEKAHILIGDKVPVITATSGAGGFVSDSVSYLDVGLRLDVEPTVFADDQVVIKVALEVSSLGAALKTASGTVAYQIGTRNANSVLRLRDGETQILAGLISKDDRTSASLVPGLGDLPFLGRLFSSELDDGRRTELVLAITPRILRNVSLPDASESEVWVGTESFPKLRSFGALQGSHSHDLEPRPASESLSARDPGGSSTRESHQVPVQATTLTQSSSVTLSWVGPSNVKVGDTFVAQILVASAGPLMGLPAEIQFEPDAIKLLDAVEGDYFKRGNAITSFTKSGEGQGGSLRMAVMRGADEAAAGQGILYLLHFKAVKPGEMYLNLVNAQAQNSGPPSTVTLPPALHVVVQ